MVSEGTLGSSRSHVIYGPHTQKLCSVDLPGQQLRKSYGSGLSHSITYLRKDAKTWVCGVRMRQCARLRRNAIKRHGSPPDIEFWRWELRNRVRQMHHRFLS